MGWSPERGLYRQWSVEWGMSCVEHWLLWSVRCKVSVECGVKSVECRVYGVACKVWGVECKVRGVECKVWGVECKVWGVECKV